MLLYILDTDMLTLYQHGTPRVVHAVNAHSLDAVGIAVITIEEQTLGWLAQARKVSQPDRVALAYLGPAAAATSWADFVIVPYPKTAIAQFDSLRKQRLNVGSNDLRIAATALEAGVTIVTRNLQDFNRVPGLSCVDWTA